MCSDYLFLKRITNQTYYYNNFYEKFGFNNFAKTSEKIFE